MTIIRTRRGTAEQWADANTILDPGEPGYEIDTGQFKIGRDNLAWDELPYFKDVSDLEGSFAPASEGFSNEKAQDAVWAMLQAGTQTGISFSYDDVNNRLSATVTVVGGGGGSTTAEDIQDVIAALFQGSDNVGISYVYDDSGNKLNAVVSSEYIQDVMASTFANSTFNNMSITYDDANNKFVFTATGGGGGGSDMTLEEFADNLQLSLLGNDSTIFLTRTDENHIVIDLNPTYLSTEIYELLKFDSSMVYSTNPDTGLRTYGVKLEHVQDLVWNMIVNGTQQGITIEYDDPAGAFNITVPDLASQMEAFIAAGGPGRGLVTIYDEESGDPISLGVDDDHLKIIADDRPVYALTKQSRYDPASRTYNTADAGMLKMRYSLAEALTGTSLVSMVYIGDSITAGHKAVPGVSDPVTMIRNQLDAMGYPVTGGWIYPANGTTRDARWATTGTWTGGALTSTNFLYTSTNGATATLTADLPGTVVEFGVFCTTNTTITYAVDGAAPITYNVVAGAYRKIQLTGLIDTTHILVITNTGSQTLWLGPARVRRATGLSITNAAVFGSLATDWLPTAGGGVYYNMYNLLMGLEMHKIAMVGLGANELINVPAATPTSVRDTLVTIGTAIKALGPALALRSYAPSIAETYAATHAGPANTMAYWQQTWFDAADLLQVPLIDHWGGLGTQAQFKAAGMSWTDNIHLLDKGNAAVTRREIEALRRMS